MRRQIACACTALLMLGLFEGGLSPAPHAAHAASVRFMLEPGTVQLGIRAYGLGLITMDGRFTRFRGVLTLDDLDPTACTVTVQAETASLQMATAMMTEDAKGPDLLDVANHPEFRLDGTCRDGRLPAVLLLHGTSRPVLLDIEQGQGMWSANGMMRRAEWGMGARPMLAGPEVRISMTAGVPPGFRPAR